MRVFSQINNCQQKQNKQTTEKKPDKTKRGAPLLGLAKSIYYSGYCLFPRVLSYFSIHFYDLWSATVCVQKAM